MLHLPGPGLVQHRLMLPGAAPDVGNEIRAGDDPVEHDLFFGFFFSSIPHQVPKAKVNRVSITCDNIIIVSCV